MLVLITITFIITWAFETISITTGFPFGRFYYTELLGVKAGEVPWGIMLAYFFIGYLAWTMGGLFLNETGESINKDNLIRVPLISAGLMVLWNMSFDPVLSTIEGNWVWINGGFHGGVPITNYFGWFLTTYIFFQLFALFLYVFKKQEHESKESWYWYLVPVLFIAQSIEYIIHPFIRTNNEPIYLASFFITLFGVVSASLLCLLVIKKRIHNL